ncbi:hypothetical protein [Streptomyces sp. A1136]|uniref:hypothetical protein n=1 Tax=Streptomyces sp. A1136 TaxID=2563102 RepID=UPI00109ED643|nr:hypothetical protein [Streptomyces sp. A1136]THA53249.1 hypothetical protein E6R62_19360 [Streptomyces sp. A1136]
MSTQTLSTSRLDAVMTEGTGHGFARIRLADGHAITLKVQPGAPAAEEVLLSPGLTAPDTEAWENEDSWEDWLTGGTLGNESGMFLDVPTDALRDLIAQHGGEHEDQDGQDPAPRTEADAAEQATQDPLAEIAELHGAFEHGYGADDIRNVFGRIYDAGGPYLVCVWDIADEYGFGGNSEFYAEDEDGSLFEVQPDIHLWLAGEQETPGPVHTWICARVREVVDFPATDDRHNYARTER